jgi:hypothetical protein
MRDVGEGTEHMMWRLYDIINGQWYNDELYKTREACLASGNVYMQEAKATGETLELLPRSLEPTPVDLLKALWKRKQS